MTTLRVIDGGAATLTFDGLLRENDRLFGENVRLAKQANDLCDELFDLRARICTECRVLHVDQLPRIGTDDEGNAIRQCAACKRVEEMAAFEARRATLIDRQVRRRDAVEAMIVRYQREGDATTSTRCLTAWTTYRAHDEQIRRLKALTFDSPDLLLVLPLEALDAAE
jgi:hypothetical protein